MGETPLPPLRALPLERSGLTHALPRPPVHLAHPDLRPRPHGGAGLLPPQAPPPPGAGAVLQDLDPHPPRQGGDQPLLPAQAPALPPAPARAPGAAPPGARRSARGAEP